MLSDNIKNSITGDIGSPDIQFPPAHLARYDGLLCVGGDLSSQRLICAYRNGIFPWFSQGQPVLWWSPDPRLVLYPDRINISKSLKKKIRKDCFAVTMDRAFEDVINSCARFRDEKRTATWLVNDMIEAYIELHKLGYAHSVETWKDGALAGGLYGASLGRVFFGESMFSYVSDASKIALAALCSHLKHHDFDLVDCQVKSAHLISMGAQEIPRRGFLRQLKTSVNRDGMTGVWDFCGFQQSFWFSCQNNTVVSG
ncbi:MAG: leucyl/phenylalanyl-tRNA--protein transferase [Desulfamplus sp.]|nr:leucyl/phenylalanyl-tRNA--protein transferase [Desulfamplus sp.]